MAKGKCSWCQSGQGAHFWWCRKIGDTSLPALQKRVEREDPKLGTFQQALREWQDAIDAQAERAKAFTPRSEPTPARTNNGWFRYPRALAPTNPLVENPELAVNIQKSMDTADTEVRSKRRKVRVVTDRPGREVDAEHRKVVEDAIAFGCEYDKNGTKKHPTITTPSGVRIPVTTTASDYRSLYNFKSQLRRAGVPV